jgi:hypothetical protein
LCYPPTCTVALNGLEDASGHLVPFTQVEFTTVPAPASGGSGVMSARGVRSDYSTAHAHHAAQAVRPGVRAELDEFEWTGPLRDGKPYSRWQDLPPLTAPPGVTALSGQVLRLNGQPLADVTLQIGDQSATTDHTGRFLLNGIASGPQELVMDGSTANRPGRTCYSSQERAESAIERLRLQPGFRETPEGFVVQRYPIDKDHWVEGFVTVRSDR